MADATYIKNIDRLWQGQVDLLGNTIKIVLCTDDYTPDTSDTGDEFLSDIPSIARIVTATLEGKTLSAGVFDALDPVFIDVPAGKTLTKAIVYQEASPESDSLLIRKITDAPPLNSGGLVTIGVDITLVLPDDANKLWKTYDKP